MDAKQQELFYIGASMYLDLDSPEVDQILADAGLDGECDTLIACREAVRQAVEPATWQVGFDSGRLLFGDGRLTLHDAPPGTELITLSEAAGLAGVTVQAISQMATRGTLTVYHDLDAPSRQGRRLVSRLEVEQL